jgi:vancomycin resistance protein YoaR
MLGLALATGVGVGGSLLPGLERFSVDLLASASGATSTERLTATAEAFLDAPQSLVFGARNLAISRRDLGLTIDVSAAALSASIDHAALERALAGVPDLNRPPRDAQIGLEGVTVTLLPDQPGHRLDREALARLLTAQARRLDDSPVTLPLIEAPATTTTAALEPVAAWLRRAPARPLTLTGLPEPAAIPPVAIARALRIEPTGAVAPDPAAWERLLTPLAVALAVEPVEPDLLIAPGRAEMVPPREGRALDIAATTAAAWRALQAGQPTVTPVFRSLPTKQKAADLAAAAALAGRLLARPPALIAGDREWPLTANDVARLLRAEDGALVVDPVAANDVVRAVDARVAEPARRPLYRWRDERAIPEGDGEPGWRLDRPAARDALIAGLARGEATLTLPLVEQPVPAPPEGVVFHDLLAEGRTYFADSARERYTNVALGLKKIDAALVPPGGEFSFNQASGPVTLANGFKKGYGIAISNGKVTTLPSVGGGICQVATTLFHAVFRAGLPIGSRSWHLYWMPRYGRPPSGMTGLDATVDDQSALDFTFFNTTGAWLLIEATVEAGNAVVRLWGVSPGWSVTVDGPVITNVVRASQKMTERPDPSLPKGARVWVEHAEDGKTVAIRRTVRDDHGRLMERRTFVSRYAPAANVTLVGTGGETR